MEFLLLSTKMANEIQNHIDDWNLWRISNFYLESKKALNLLNKNRTKAGDTIKTVDDIMEISDFYQQEKKIFQKRLSKGIHRKVSLLEAQLGDFIEKEFFYTFNGRLPSLDEQESKRDKFTNGKLVPYQGSFGKYTKN